MQREQAIFSAAAVFNNIHQKQKKIVIEQ